jgi:hypothetical protein
MVKEKSIRVRPASIDDHTMRRARWDCESLEKPKRLPWITSERFQAWKTSWWLAGLRMSLYRAQEIHHVLKMGVKTAVADHEVDANSKQEETPKGVRH